MQDDPRSDGEISLLHLANDPEIEFDINDAGTLQWFGSAADLRGRRWDRLTVWTSSC